MFVAASIGITPVLGINLIHAIPLKTGTQLTISPKAQKALILASGLIWSWDSEEIKKDGKHHGHRIKASRYMGEGRPPLTAEVSYTIDDAVNQGTAGKDNWKKVPQRMTLWRATGYIADELFSDISNNIQSAALFDVEITEDGEVVQEQYEEGDYEEIESEAINIIEEFTKLLTDHGADEVYKHCTMPPANEAELNELKEKLKNGK